MSGHNDMHADDIEGQLSNAIAGRELALRLWREAETRIAELEAENERLRAVVDVAQALYAWQMAGRPRPLNDPFWVSPATAFGDAIRDYEENQ